MPFLIFPPAPMLFSLLEWYILPLSNFNSSFCLLLLIQTMFLIVNLVSLPAFLPQKSLMQAVRWGPSLCPKPASKKTLQSTPFKQNTYETRFDTSLIIEASLCLLTDSNLTVCPTPPCTNTNPLTCCIKSFPPLYFFPVFPSVSQSRAASLSPPPYVVIIISCSGLVSFVLLLLTCLCCKKGGVGFNVSLQHVRHFFTSLCFLCFVTPLVHACMGFI